MTNCTCNQTGAFETDPNCPVHGDKDKAPIPSEEVLADILAESDKGPERRWWMQVGVSGQAVNGPLTAGVEVVEASALEAETRRADNAIDDYQRVIRERTARAEAAERTNQMLVEDQRDALDRAEAAEAKLQTTEDRLEESNRYGKATANELKRYREMLQAAEARADQAGKAAITVSMENRDLRAKLEAVRFALSDHGTHKDLVERIEAALAQEESE